MIYMELLLTELLELSKMDSGRLEIKKELADIYIVPL